MKSVSKELREAVADRSGPTSATVAAVERLLANPEVDVNDENRNGKRAIHFAAQLSSDTEVLTMLINASADVNAATHRGHTPLIYAAGRSRAQRGGTSPGSWGRCCDVDCERLLCCVHGA